MSNAIEVTDLSKRYAATPTPAVDGLSFSVATGEILGFLGPNGAGKTTTLSMLACLLPIGGGRASITGFDVARQPNDVKRRIGLVPQDLALYPTLSARDNLRFFGSLYGLWGGELARRADEALERVGLASRGGDAVQSFSGGMKRRINIAAALLHRPEVLLLDEPTVGVDPQSRNFILDGIELLCQDGLTVLYSTHYMEEAERLCDRVAIVDHGRIVALDTPEALVARLEPVKPNLEMAFLQLTGSRLRD